MKTTGIVLIGVSIALVVIAFLVATAREVAADRLVQAGGRGDYAAINDSFYCALVLAAFGILIGVLLLGFGTLAPKPPAEPRKIGYASGLSRKSKASLCAMVQAKKRKEADDDFLDTLR